MWQDTLSKRWDMACIYQLNSYCRANFIRVLAQAPVIQSRDNYRTMWSFNINLNKDLQSHG